MFKQPPLKRKILLVLGILIILSCFIGVSYALWIFTDSQRDENIVNLDCFEIHFSEANVLNLQNSFPLRDSDGEALQPYHFKIENKCNSYAKYVLTIETNQSSTLDTKYLKVKTNENTPVIMNSLNPGEVKKKENKEAYVIDTGYLDKLESKDYDVRIWLDEKVTVDTLNEDGTKVQRSKWNGFVNLSVAYSNKIERSAFLAGMEVPVIEEGTGLYKVDHSEYEGETAGFSQTEYRYAGLDPDNYVDFNNEKWRIIGLVNVLTTDGTVTQRLKIIKAEVDAEYRNITWDSENTNDWTNASLQTTLNGGYLSEIQATFRNMIATDIRWNLGGFSSDGVITSQYYEYERGITVVSGNPTYWENSGQATVALMYPSDYGYATSGGSTYNRSQCLSTVLRNWNETGYNTNCVRNDWLYDSSNIQWTLMPNSVYSSRVFYVSSTGYVGYTDGLVRNSFAVRPALYLKPDVQIVRGSGTITDSYQLKAPIVNTTPFPDDVLAKVDQPSDDGNGLYTVEHNDVEITDENGEIVPGWDGKELRYAGPNPNNYVDFNGEKWRIIGLVNVQTTSGTITQRLKIIKADIYTSTAWDNAQGNDWSSATLKTTLNGTYLDSMTNKDMIATDIRWNLGGSSTGYGVLTSQYYEYERGTTVYSENPTYWEGQVALMYPSDYGYASSGGSTYNRSQCLAKELYNWNTSSYQTDCAGNDWLYDSSNYQWTLMPHSGNSYYVFFVHPGGYVFNNYLTSNLYAVRPVVYLKSEVKIISNENANGSEEHPFTLSME